MSWHVDLRNDDHSSLISILDQIGYFFRGIGLLLRVCCILSKFWEIWKNKREAFRVSKVEMKGVHLACHESINSQLNNIKRQEVSRTVEHHSSVA